MKNEYPTDEQIAFSCLRTQGMSPKKILELRDHLGSIHAVWKMHALQDTSELFQSHEALFSRYGIHLLFSEASRYPSPLREIYQYPRALFVRGNTDALLHPKMLAVVGTRRMTPYGERVLHHCIPQLVEQGFAIVSGLAYGIDGLAHRLTLQHGGVALGVCGTGVDRVYPAQHRHLVDDILASGGAIISELPLGAPPLRQHFPARNRIISGVSHATLVVEAQQRSGSLITARFALEQNRDVYAVPGEIFSEQQQGTNALIAEGAIPFLSVGQLLEGFGIQSPTEKMLSTTPERNEFQVIHLLLEHPLHQDDVLSRCPWPVPQTQAFLTQMHMQGYIRQNVFLEWERAL